MSSQLAIQAVDVSKAFMIPHEQRTRLKETFVHPFHRTTYERNQALANVTFDVMRGEFFGVIGANGSGKSTLLKILAHIYRADAGTVRINGRLSPFIELGVGFNYELSARENVEINGTLLGLNPAELAERLDPILEFAELTRFVDQQLKNFSSGMLLRLAFSIAIQVPFDILLLDEVLAVGDERFQQKCFDSFERIRGSGRTVVLVSHALESITRFCDRALYLSAGEVQRIGPAGKIVDEYRERVAGRPTASIRP